MAHSDVAAYAGSDNNLVAGNYFGTNAAGTASVPSSWWGASIAQGANSLIGGATPAARNLISGN